ncbi:free fatty acid receptor 2-like [Tiliqua scincoides]|uniref:free fatty acid receptor 2-like n=1 Tax=Tiliqua scincoides TaxID=71010 RepID=UPI0034635E51
MAQEHIVILAFYIFTFLTGLPSNLLACYTFLMKVRRKPAPIDILLLNLTVSDLILLLFLPFKMVEAAANMSWPLPMFLCPLTNFCFYSSIYLSTLFLMAVSVERFLNVAYPVKYKLLRRPAYTVAASFFFWLIAYSHLSVIFIIQGDNSTQTQDPGDFHCYDNFSPSQLSIVLPFRLELCVVLFCIPFLITLFCYVNVIRILASLPNIQPHKKQRAVGLAVATLLNFAICFAPYNISHIVGFILKNSSPWRAEVLVISALNTTLDPIVFFFSSTAIRRNFTTCFRGTCMKLKASDSPCSCCRCPEKSGKETDAGTASSEFYPGTRTATEASCDQVSEVRASHPAQQAHPAKRGVHSAH